MKNIFCTFTLLQEHYHDTQKKSLSRKFCDAAAVVANVRFVATAAVATENVVLPDSRRSAAAAAAGGGAAVSRRSRKSQSRRGGGGSGDSSVLLLPPLSSAACGCDNKHLPLLNAHCFDLLNRNV
jgi:hypothetical protein